MTEENFDRNVWILYFNGLDEGEFEPCNLNAFLSEEAALDFSKKAMRKKWPGSDEAYGLTAGERDYLIDTALEELKNGKEAQVADYRWSMIRLTAQ